jgi:WD40-like Beta Propeller Repeat
MSTREGYRANIWVPHRRLGALRFPELFGGRQADCLPRVLTTEYDNLTAWSPDGTLIAFTRRVDAVNFDIFTIRRDGSDLQRLTTGRANVVMQSGPRTATSCGQAVYTAFARRRRCMTTPFSHTAKSSS